jgi:hypothetical protein
MARSKLRLALAASASVFSALVLSTAPGRAQAQPPVPAAQSPNPPAAQGGEVKGGEVKGTVRSGSTPLPGVSVLATNTLTGAKYATVTDAGGAFDLRIPANGRYVLHADLAAFAPAVKEVLLKNGAQAAADFSLVLASRQRLLEEAQSRQAAPNGSPAAGQNNARTRQYAGAGTQNLGLLAGSLGAAASGQTGNAGASLPSAASNSDFGSESVAVAGQTGTTSPFAGINMDQMRENFEDMQQQRTLSQIPGASGGGQGGFFGGRGGGGGGGFRVRPGNFRKYNPNVPHGAFFWNGGNSALDARDFAIRGQQVPQPPYASNRFGLTVVGVPYIPRLLTHDTKDFIFLTLSGQRSSSPFDQYGTVPDALERSGDLSGLVTPGGLPITIYDPATGLPFPHNLIPGARISPQARALLNFIPGPNLPTASFQNYQRLTTAQTNTTTLGLRYVRNFGSGSAISSMLQQFLGASAPGKRQSINANFNLSHTAEDELNLFPQLGGSQQMHQYSLQLGYSLGINKLTNNFGVNWNRSNLQLTNYFTNKQDVAGSLGLGILNGGAVNPVNYGLPSITLTQFTGLTELQPNLQLNQVLGLSESSIWTHGKHNVRWGGDFKRVHLNLLGQANSTGNFIFTGLATQQPGVSGVNGSGSSGSTGLPTSGSALADFLLGLPQQTAIQAPYQTSHLRENIYDAYLQDDWRARPSFTLNAGLRYEYFSPYSEANNRLATLDTGNNFASVATVTAGGTGPFTGRYPNTLVYPDRDGFAPRIGFAWKALRDTVVRGGYGLNWANGQYVKFVQDFAFQSPFADVQTNEASPAAPLTLAHGFAAPQTLGNYAVNKNFRLPYVQVWNLNVQRTLPLAIVLNVGWTGAKGSRLDIVDAPGRTATASLSGVLYDYEDSTAFSNYNAGTIRLRKRLQDGIALGATYTYAHAIDDASSIGANGGTAVAVAQNWQDLRAEESNSSFDIRHQLKGDFLYELPFGPDAHFLSNNSWYSHALSNWSVSGNYTFATGEPLTPHFEANIADVARGSAGSLRPNRVPNSSLTANGGTIRRWFNPAAFAQLAPGQVYGTASRYSIPGPGTVAVDMSLSKTIRFTETRTFEMRATGNNVFNTVQYAGVDTTLESGTYGEVTSAAQMRQLTFLARFRY